MFSFSGHNLACMRGDRLVFHNLDFQAARGDAILLLGPNGSGKSSLLRIMAGLLKPASGDLLWAGQPVHEDTAAHAERLHYLGHHDPVKPAMSALEIVTFWAAMDRPDAPGSPGARARTALDEIGIGHIADVPGRFLSSGQKRRVNLARILATPAPLWLLDEPTTGLDLDGIGRLEHAINEHRLRGGLVALSTHVTMDVPDARVLQLNRFTPRIEDFASDEEDALFDGPNHANSSGPGSEMAA